MCVRPHNSDRVSLVGELPDEVSQIHFGFLRDIRELHNHAFACVHAAYYTFYTDGFRKHDAGGELRAAHNGSCVSRYIPEALMSRSIASSATCPQVILTVALQG